MRKYFGTDGVRGKANEFPLTADFALKLGRSVASIFCNGSTTHPKIVIGKDTRISSYMFEHALVAGICSAGVNPIIVGVLPTPAIAFMTRSLRADAGVVISASHNPYHDNGIKFFDKNGCKLSDEVELQIEKMIDTDFTPQIDMIGKAFRIETAIGRYVEFVKQTYPKSITLKGLKIVVDLANGAGYRVCPMALDELGAEVIAINDEPNGYNINDNCGAVYPQRMTEAVREHKADIGISLDGDADRVIFSDSDGSIVDGDKIMGICAIDMLNEGRLKQNSIVATVMSNLGFERSMNSKGIRVIRSKVGDRYVMDEMIKNDINLGGEQSGHLIFSDFNTTGDGIISALQLLQVMVKNGKTLKELSKDIESYPQILKNIKVSAKPDIASLIETTKLIKDIESKLGKDGRVLVRYSGTENKLRVMLEGINQNVINAYADDIIDIAIKEIGG